MYPQTAKQKAADELKEKCKEFVGLMECSPELKGKAYRAFDTWIGRCFAQENRLRRERERQESRNKPKIKVRISNDDVLDLIRGSA